MVLAVRFGDLYLVFHYSSKKTKKGHLMAVKLAEVLSKNDFEVYLYYCTGVLFLAAACSTREKTRETRTFAVIKNGYLERLYMAPEPWGQCITFENLSIYNVRIKLKEEE